MPRNAFGDDDSAWSLPTTNSPPGSLNGSQNESFSAQPPSAGAVSPTSPPPSWSYQQPTAPAGGASPFGRAAAAAPNGFGVESSGPVGAPRVWLAAAVVAVVVGAAIGFAAHGQPAFSVIGWLLAGAVAVGLLAAFTLQDTKRQASIWYTGSQSISMVRNAILALAVLAVALNAWQFADWAARR